MERIRVFFKEIEHGKVKDVTGAEVDKLIKDSDDFLKRIDKLFKQISQKKEKEGFDELYKAVIKTVEEANLSAEIKATNIELGFKKYCAKEGLPAKFVTDFKSFMKAYKDFKAKKLTKAESDVVKREVRTFLRIIEDHMQRKRFLGVERAKVRFKHGTDKTGEILLLKDVAFITKSIGAKSKDIIRVDIDKKGRLKNPTKTDVLEMDKILVSTEIPKALSVKEGIFEDLKEIIGKDIEIIF